MCLRVELVGVQRGCCIAHAGRARPNCESSTGSVHDDARCDDARDSDDDGPFDARDRTKPSDDAAFCASSWRGG